MLSWVLDIFVAAWITMLDVLLLAGYWFAESLKQWAAEQRTAAPTARFCLVLAVATAGFGAIGVGFYWADLLVTATTQMVMAAAVLLVLLLGLGTECARWAARCAERHRLRRERRRSPGS
ncbi:hypothetical protein OG204_34800 [Streptomyces sp. NBC_01387]|uniref:hypothetical protein n=1 Tax=unclassified Streptomyces TaxID=2593676 RepID=UPI002DDC5773|nr:MULTISPECIES: hypothetical protein [unclassified Streptomyces]WSC18209.1 hypothetical protein OIE60_00295 [Streptomyces sp. NBC_01766]